MRDYEQTIRELRDPQYVYHYSRDYLKNMMDDAADAIEELLLSAQQEIVRCGDCKHRNAENGFCEGRGWPMQLVPDDGFCDKGERSEE